MGGGKKTYKLVHVLDPDKIVLADKRAFGKNKTIYEQFHADLKKEWSRRHSAPVTERKTEFVSGEHVLVKSQRLEAPRRGIVLDKHGMVTSTGEPTYSVFVYDEGDIESIENNRITSLSENHKQQLEPRTVIVRLIGLVPAKLVVDHAKMAVAVGGASVPLMITQDHQWSTKAKRLTAEWLSHPNIKSIRIIKLKTNEDGSVFGEIYRKFHTVFQDTNSENPTSKDEETEKRKNKEFLTHYLCSEKLALFNETLAESQSKLRDTLKERAARKKHGKDGPVVESQAVKEDDGGAKDYDESLLNETRVQLDSGCSSPDPSYIPLPRKPVPVNVTHPDDNGGAIVEPSPSLSDDIGNYDESVLSETRHSLDDIEKTNTSDNLPLKPSSSRQNVKTEHKAIRTPSFSGSDNSSSYSEHLRRAKSNLVDTRTDAGNELNIPGRLLVRGKMVKPAYARMQEYGLNKAIVKALEANGFAELSDVHKLVAPNFLRGSDIIVISPDGGKLAGKNCRVLTYILSILRILYDKITYQGKVDEKSAPEAVLIVNSYNTGKSVETFIQSLLNFCQDVPLKVKFICKDTAMETTQNQRKGNYEKNMIPGGISILITTMTYLEACMQTKDGPFLFKRLRFLIFEEVELYLKGYSEDMLTFINAARENLRICFEGLPFQIVFSGNKWSPEIEVLYKEMVKDRAPMVFISATNQVLHYARIKWKVHYVQEENKKLEQLSELLKTCLEEHKRLVVACSTPSVAQTVFQYLESTLCQTASVLISTNQTDQDNHKHNIHVWRQNNSSVFILSDDMIRLAEVTNATCLVCFDSPELRIQGNVKRSVAAERFGYMWSNIRHIESEQPEYMGSASSLEKDDNVQELVTHFLMTGEEHNFYAMYKFAKSLSEGVEFPPELEEIALMAEREGLLNVAMCQGTRLFGFCSHPDPANCPARHFFTRQELKQPTCAPFYGEIEFRVIKCDNPSSYQVQLMRHYDFLNNKRVCKRTYLNDYRRRKSELRKYYESSERELLSVFKEGTWCVVRIKELDEQFSYARAQVERIVQKDKHDVPRVVRVKCVDTGHILNPSVDQMFEITPKFKEWKPLVINLILCNLRPCRMENEYRNLSEKKARSLTTDKIFNAKIWLSIGNTVWVNPMVEYHVDPETKEAYRGESIRLALIYDKIAEFNKNHLQVMVELVRKYPGVYEGALPDWATGESQSLDDSLGSDELEMAKTEFHQIGDDIQWAFVRKSGLSKFDPVKIVTQYGYDPWMFFGVQDKFYDQLKKLEKELDACVNKYIHGSEEDDQRFTGYKSLFKNYYEPGMVVAAKERVDQVWMRALIVQKYKSEDVEGGNEKQMKFEVFFVDYGDSCKDMKMEELFPMPRTFVSRMPFQIIAFKLDHIRPLDGREQWTSDECGAFLDLIVKNGLSIDVDVLAYEDTEDIFSEIEIPCRYYNAFALYHQKDLGAQFVEDGMAAWTPGKEDLPKKVADGLLRYYNAAVNQALESDEDEGVEEESRAPELEYPEYDCYINGNEIYDFFGIKQNGITPKIPDMHASSPLSESSDPQPAIQAASTSKPMKTPTKSLPQRDGASLLVPNVTWRQTESLLILKIFVPDIMQYELNVVDKNTIQFRTLNHKPKDYGFTCKVFGKLETQFGVNLTGLSLTVKFTKKMGGVKWPRVLYSRDEKFHWLKEDLEYLTDDVEEEMGASHNTADASVLQEIQNLNMNGNGDKDEDQEFDDLEEELGLEPSYGVDSDEFSDSEE